MTTRYEAEIIPGLADIAELELREQIGASITIEERTDSAIRFSCSDNPALFLDLKSIVSVYRLQSFNIPRPKALLGHQNFHQLLDTIQTTLAGYGRESFQTLHLSAAGSGSSVMRRIKDELSDHLNLKVDNTEGDALLRLRPTPGRKRHWDALIRLTPRPLATRNWRVCNLPGALNGTVAHAMVRLSRPCPDDTVINLTCGSATLLIERAHHMTSHHLAGIDNNSSTLQCASENMTADSPLHDIQLIQGDATQTPFVDNIADVLLADLPFGQLTGSHDENIWLYPALMAEAARIAKSGARFVLITHEVNLTNSVLEQLSSLWHCHEERMINLSGLHPRIYVLERL